MAAWGPWLLTDVRKSSEIINRTLASVSYICCCWSVCCKWVQLLSTKWITCSGTFRAWRLAVGKMAYTITAFLFWGISITDKWKHWGLGRTQRRLIQWKNNVSSLPHCGGLIMLSIVCLCFTMSPTAAQISNWPHTQLVRRFWLHPVHHLHLLPFQLGTVQDNHGCNQWSHHEHR